MKTIKATFLVASGTLFFLSVSAQSTSIDASQIGDNAKVGRYVKTRGINMYYETYGTGEPMLMIHSNGGSISNFMYQVPYFAINYKVIVADSRAQGKTADTKDSLTYEMMADDFNGLLDSLHLDSCYAIGWGDGAIDALLLAVRHPDKVKKMAITGAYLSPDTSAVDPSAYDWALNYNASFRKIRQTPEVRNNSKVAHLLSYEPHININLLRKIQCPTLVIGGDHEVVLPKHTVLIAQTIPKSYLWVLPNAGHSTPIFHKDLFNQVVGDFFRTPYKKPKAYDLFN
jgi:pimeloyl-ACP methyl ester carboxylesterase